jgi:hypothetical protein
MSARSVVAPVAWLLWCAGCTATHAPASDPVELQDDEAARDAAPATAAIEVWAGETRTLFYNVACDRTKSSRL